MIELSLSDKNNWHESQIKLILLYDLANNFLFDQVIELIQQTEIIKNSNT